MYHSSNKQNVVNASYRYGALKKKLISPTPGSQLFPKYPLTIDNFTYLRYK